MGSMAFDYEQISVELIKVLRGNRSQLAFSRRLKYSSNVAYTWESKRRWPTASVVMWAATRVGIDVPARLAAFHPALLESDSFDTTTKEGVAAFLNELRGATPTGEVASRMRRNRFAVSRWLRGQSEPRLPEFLHMIEATSMRLMDFLAALVEPVSLPSIYGEWQKLQRSRNLFFDHPWTQVVLLCLELSDYTALSGHDDSWIATRTGIPVKEVKFCIEALAMSGQILKKGAHWKPHKTRTINMQRTEQDVRTNKAFWSRQAIERFEHDAPGMFSHNLFTVNEQDFIRLQELHRSYFLAVRSVVADSSPGERIVLATMSMQALGS